MDFSDFGRQFGNFRRTWDFAGPKNHYSEYSPFARPRQVPVHRQAPPPSPSPPQKVFSVPVQFFRSERNRPDTAAVKIQKAFRGFLVRKTVPKIAEIKIEVDEIEMRVSRKETVELLRTEAKERLRFSEALMRLLERLDSVSVIGSDSRVRELRRSVAGKANALLDRVDAAAAVVDGGGGNGDETLEQAGDDSEWENRESISEIADVVEKPQIDEALELQSAAPAAECEPIDQDASCDHHNSTKDDNAEGDCAMDIAKAEREENKRSRELLERVVEDNKKMMGMMMQLFERNEKQTQMLSSLANRVDKMERVIACERMRRRKKRHDAAAGDFLVWRAPDNGGRGL